MKLFTRLISIILFLGCGTIGSCDRCNGEYSFAHDNDLSFTILDRTTLENILHVRNMNFNYDTVKVYSENWEIAFDSPVPFDGVIFLEFIDPIGDRNILDQLISKRFYMYFNYQDIDTIDIAFKMDKKNSCNAQAMSYFKVSYNDSVYFDNEVNDVPGIDFLK